MKKYTYEFKKKLCKMVCINHNSTCKTAKGYGIPLKTLEKWITAYNINNKCFDFEYINNEKVKKQLLKQAKALKIENEILRKTFEILKRSKQN